MGVDVAAEAGLRVVNVACHTVPCHLQLKFAEFFFFPPQLERSVTLSYNVPGDAGIEGLHFPFFFVGRGGGC